MNTERIRLEYDTLTDIMETTMNDGAIILEDIQLPDRCTPDTTDLRITYPNAYPAQPPTLHVADRIQIDGRTPTELLPRSDPEEWIQFDIHTRHWDPDRHTAVTLYRLFMYALRHTKASADPFD